MARLKSGRKAKQSDYSKNTSGSTCHQRSSKNDLGSTSKKNSSKNSSSQYSEAHVEATFDSSTLSSRTLPSRPHYDENHDSDAAPQIMPITLVGKGRQCGELPRICCSRCAKEKDRTEFLKGSQLLKRCIECRTRVTQYGQRQRQTQRQLHPSEYPWRIPVTDSSKLSDGTFSIFRQSPDDPQRNQATDSCNPHDSTRPVNDKA